jgi:hypothetical protein
VIHEAVFDGGLEFLTKPFKAQWAEGQKRLERIDEHGYAADIDVSSSRRFRSPDRGRARRARRARRHAGHPDPRRPCLIAAVRSGVPVCRPSAVAGPLLPSTSKLTFTP